MSDPHPKPTPKPVPRPVARPAASPAPQPTPTQVIQPTMSESTLMAAGGHALPPKGKFSKLIGPLIILVVCIAVGGGLYLMVKKNREALAAQLAKNAAIEKAEQEALRQAKGLGDDVSATNSNNPPQPVTRQNAKAKLQMQLIASNYTNGATWTDSSGMGNHAKRVGAPTKVPGVTPTGADAVRFNGTSDLFALPDFASGFTSGEAFVVVKLDVSRPTARERTGLWKFGTEQRDMHYPWLDGRIIDDFGSSARYTSGELTEDLAKFNIYHVRSEAGSWEGRINNVVRCTAGQNTVTFRTDPYLGRSSGDYYLDGDIAEFRFYEGLLTAEERDAIFNSLKSTYITP